MSLVRIECNGCHAVLQVRAEMAGQQGRCPKCGNVVTILAPPPSDVLDSIPPGDTVISRTAPAPLPELMRPPQAPASTLPLGQAMGADIVAEIARRKKSAVLLVFETPLDGSYDISAQPQANVRCFRTSDMNDAQLMQVLSELGKMTQGQPTVKGGVGLQSGPDELPFELKGDRLGITLRDFKTKYARALGGIRLPYCSDSSPGQPNATLWSEPWHAAAGIVHGRVELPSENNSPTVAGVKTEIFLYHFVDGRLFRMTALFDTEAFHLVREAMVQKYGTPARESKDPMELRWENAASAMYLVRGTMRPKKLSSIVLTHHELQALADSRVPQRETDL
jgi:hypothetical protein